MSAGLFHRIVGVDFVTLIVTVFEAVLKFVVSVGVKSTFRTCALPKPSTVPAAGVYTGVPTTLNVAFSCVSPSAVPYEMSAGFDQVMVGVAFRIVTTPLTKLNP